MTNNWKYIVLMAAAFPATAALAQSGDAGRRAVELENYQEAKNIYKSQLNDKKAADNAYFALGDIYLRTDKPDSAAYYFNQGIANNKKSAINYVGLGKLELERGNKAKAEQNFEEALKQSKSKDAYVLTMIAEAYINANNATEQDINKAIGYLETARERESNSPLTNVVLGDAYLKQNNGGKAMSAYDRAIQLDDKYALAYLKRGQLYTSSRNFNEAQEALLKAIEINPNFAPAYRDLGELYYFAGQYDKALSTFKKYVDMAEDTPETKAKYASFLFLTKNYDETLQQAQAVLQKDPNNLTMNRLEAYSYVELKQPEKAKEAMEDYLQKAGEQKLISSDYAYYGRILNQNNQPEKAIENMEKALSMDDSNADLYSDLASLYANQGKYDKAIEAYKRKRKNVEPSNADYYYMGNIYMQAGADSITATTPEKAKEYFQQADSTYAKVVEANPSYAYAYLWRARANASQDPETTEGLAKPYYEEFIKQTANEKDKYKKDLIEANSYLGYYYMLKGDKNNSGQYWNAVLALDPTNENAQAALKQLGVTAKK
ncbi:tetratricopeptide repeat protein [Pontibacter silvestris]|uniref:Tetratricopeptide repeat protein n=1 Tax=Pontibacter silvestris TaxID=2305183 RepID=A0ABW4WXK6_9BACT|nr:tetratricopeptide repeat protein [Pontibacter silvestris]MCC9136405.1 tetratricopeptide repeat protein [Pontibacter silvestris]